MSKPSFLVDNRSESWKVLEVLECLTNNKIATSSKDKVRLLILRLVRSSTYERSYLQI
jgi:hypothetical protein